MLNVCDWMRAWCAWMLGWLPYIVILYTDCIWFICCQCWGPTSYYPRVKYTLFTSRHLLSTIQTMVEGLGMSKLSWKGRARAEDWSMFSLETTLHWFPAQTDNSLCCHFIHVQVQCCVCLDGSAVKLYCATGKFRCINKISPQIKTMNWIVNKNKLNPLKIIMKPF